MGFMDNVKKAAAKTKLQGEVLLIDREIASTKQKHGVFIYDALFQRHHAEGEKTPLPIEGLEAAFVAAMEDMADLQSKKLEKDHAIDALEEKQQAATKAAAEANQAEGGDAPAAATSHATAGDRAKKAGKTIQNAGASTKLKAEMAYYSREMRVRKEIFGVQVFDDLDLMSRDEGRFEEGEDGVGAALNNAIDACKALLQRKQEKVEDIKALN